VQKEAELACRRVLSSLIDLEEFIFFFPLRLLASPAANSNSNSNPAWASDPPSASAAMATDSSSSAAADKNTVFRKLRAKSDNKVCYFALP
jgi:hypothetical protein